MHGSGRAASSRPGDWPPRWGLGRRCRRVQLQLQRALRGGSARLGLGCTVMASAAAGAAAMPAPEGSGEPAKPRQKTLSDFGHPRRRTTDVLLCINAAVFVLNWLSRDILLLWGLKVNSLIAAGQVWRLVTPLFLHSNLFHLGINMHALHTLGPQVEVVSGSGRMAVIYMASGVLATAASFMWCAAPSLGASGAVFGLGAALGVFYWRHRDVLGPASDSGLRSLGLTAAINVAYSMVNPKLDNWGHAGGMLGGALLAYLLGPRFVGVQLPNGGGRALLDQPPLPWLAFGAPTPSGGVGGGPTLPARRRRSMGPAVQDAAEGRRPGSGGEGGAAAAAGSG